MALKFGSHEKRGIRLPAFHLIFSVTGKHHFSNDLQLFLGARPCGMGNVASRYTTDGNLRVHGPGSHIETIPEKQLRNIRTNIGGVMADQTDLPAAIRSLRRLVTAVTENLSE